VYGYGRRVLRVNPATRSAHFAINLGPHVQTLTRAMTAILCKGLDDATPEAVLDVPQISSENRRRPTRRVRSQTVYYILTRMKSVCKVWLNRERAAS